jgi:hypothetical protein
MCAAANDDSLRITTQNAAASGSPQQEWWYDLTRKEWTGPHTSAMSVLSPWRATFIGALVGVNATLWQSDATQHTDSIFIENGSPLVTTATTSLLPDSGSMAMNSIVDASIFCAIGANAPLVVTALNPDGTQIDMITLKAPGTWGQFNWGSGLWGPVVARQRALYWNAPIVMKQCQFSFSAVAAGGARIGNLYMKYQILGYNIEAAA